MRVIEQKLSKRLRTRFYKFLVLPAVIMTLPLIHALRASAQEDDAIKLLALSLKCPIAWELVDPSVAVSYRGTVSQEFEGDRATLKVRITSVKRELDPRKNNNNGAVTESRSEEVMTARFADIDVDVVPKPTRNHPHQTGLHCRSRDPCIKRVTVDTGAEGWAPNATLDFCKDGAAQDALAAIKSIQGDYAVAKPEPGRARSWLGVRIQEVTDDIAEYLKISPAHGALVASVDDKGPAKPADIEPGDVIISFDGHEIKEMHDLPQIIADTPVGKVVDVIVIRNGKQETHKITVGRLQDSDKVAEAKPEPAPEKSVVQKTLGLELSAISDDLRKKFKIKDNVNGVLVTGVDSSVASTAPDKRLSPGDVIVEVQYQPVADPADLQNRIDQLKSQGKKIAVLLVSSGDGVTRFVALNL